MSRRQSAAKACQSPRAYDGKIELPDHYTALEVAFDTLGKAAAKAIVKDRDTKTIDETRTASVEGAKVAGQGSCGFGEAARQARRVIGELLAQTGEECRATGA
jgi:hypothetical protein